jgi:hypothetical protein
VRELSRAPFERRAPQIERRRSSVRPLFDPAAAPFRLLLVGRIADDDGDQLLALDLVRRSPRFRDGLDDLRQLFLFDEGVAERVGDEEVEFGRRRLFRLRRIRRRPSGVENPDRERRRPRRLFREAFRRPVEGPSAKIEIVFRFRAFSRRCKAENFPLGLAGAMTRA